MRLQSSDGGERLGPFLKRTGVLVGHVTLMCLSLKVVSTLSKGMYTQRRIIGLGFSKFLTSTQTMKLI